MVYRVAREARLFYVLSWWYERNCTVRARSIYGVNRRVKHAHDHGEVKQIALCSCQPGSVAKWLVLGDKIDQDVSLTQDIA